MKVALLSFDFGEYCIRLASGLAKYTKTCLLLPSRRAEPHLSRLDPAVEFRPFAKARLRQPLRQMWMIRDIVREIRQCDPDVIHFQHRHLWFTFALPFLKQYPLVITIHNPRNLLGDWNATRIPQAITDRGYLRADQVIVHANQLKLDVVGRLGIPSDAVHVIPHILLGDDAAYNHIQEEDNLVLFFGRIWEYKGLEYLIRAEPLIRANVPDVRFVIAGEGEDFNRYRRMMVHPECYTIYNEYVSHERRAELFRRASIVVLPYVDAAQSGVIPIAYRFGKPVVATRVGGLPEMVEDGRTGVLVPPRDESALADAIVRLLRDKRLRHQLGANGKRKVDSECSPDAVAQATIAVYHRAIDDRQSSDAAKRSDKPRSNQ